MAVNTQSRVDDRLRHSAESAINERIIKPLTDRIDELAELVPALVTKEKDFNKALLGLSRVEAHIDRAILELHALTGQPKHKNGNGHKR